MGAKPEQLELIAEGVKGRVRITAGCKKQLKNAADRVEADLRALARRAVDYGFGELHEQQFKRVDRIPSSKPGGSPVVIHEFKPFKFRVYGVLTMIGDFGDFVGFVGAVKKRNPADRDDLVRAARMSEE